LRKLHCVLAIRLAADLATLYYILSFGLVIHLVTSQEEKVGLGDQDQERIDGTGEIKDRYREQRSCRRDVFVSE
jgi:hypothetical protein